MSPKTNDKVKRPLDIMPVNRYILKRALPYPLTPWGTGVNNKSGVKNLFTTQKAIVAVLIVSILIAVFVPSRGPDNQLNVLFGAASFVFGIVIAFFISISTGRLNDIGQTLNQEDANYASIYKLVAVFGPAIQEETRKYVDFYLQDQIDHFLWDYEQTRATFDKLVEFIMGLKPTTDKESAIYGKLLDYVEKLQNDRVRVIALVKSRLQPYEWATILTLAVIILFCIFALNNHSLVSVVVSVLLSTATVMLIMILRDLDLLRWKEQMWIWSCLDETFSELGITPYYPLSGVLEGRISLRKGETVRLVSYPDPYPDFSRKKVEERKI